LIDSIRNMTCQSCWKVHEAATTPHNAHSSA
jgi:hypothetical protein